MIKGNRPDPLDSIIDQALSEYASAEPLAGIEKRVLNRIAAADAALPIPKILAWAVCCPIFIGLLALAVAVWMPVEITPAHIDFPSLSHIAPPPNALLETVGPPRRSTPRRRHKSMLSSDERRLLALFESHPVESQQIFADMQRRNQELVEIDQIQIPPLQISEVQ